jgi:hypothetical protein
MDKLELLTLINSKEPEAIIRALAMMAYNPAIGRVIEKGGVDQFAELMIETVPKFYGLVSRERFNAIHAETCEQMLSTLKTNRGETLSYGQVQKPLNVFLKVYVDWAKQPSRDLAEKLSPLLHVPLDSLLMGFIAREFPCEYSNRIALLRARLATSIAEAMKTTPREVERILLRQQFSLAGINREMYTAWQDLLFSLYPAKPIALDIIWVLERTRLRAEGAAEAELDS